MNTEDKKTQAFKALILECADFSGYDEVSPTPTSEKGIITSLSDIFHSEKSVEIERIGYYNAAKDWFQGLCSACEIPYMNADILDFYGENELDSDNVEHLIYDDYYFTASEVFVDMIQGRA